MSLPNTLIAGGAKCGTSTLFHVLRQHPEICGPKKEEVDFFTSDFEFKYGQVFYEWYYYNAYRGEKVLFDINPDYIYQPLALKRIRDVYSPENIFIFVRNPVKRMTSHYWHNVRFFWENRTLSEAVEAELSDGQKWPSDQIIEDSRFRYVGCGQYLKHYNALRDIFPQAKVCFIKFEEFFRNGAVQANMLFSKLGLADTPVKNRHDNRGGKRRVDLMQKAVFDFKVGNGETKNLTGDAMIVWDGENMDRLVLNPSQKAIQWAENAKKLYDQNIEPDLLSRVQEAHFSTELAELESVSGLDLSDWAA